MLDILNYEKPTEEEVGLVLAYWDAVRNHVNRISSMPEELADMPRELLDQVAVHQAWQAAMLCQHSEGVTISYNEPMTCNGCHRPMQFLSDVQVQDLKKE